MCVFAHEYFVFLGRVTNPSAKPLISVTGHTRLDNISEVIRKELEIS